MLVSEVLPAVPTGVKALAQVDVAMLPHVVHCGVVLSAAGINIYGIYTVYIGYLAIGYKAKSVIRPNLGWYRFPYSKIYWL